MLSEPISDAGSHKMT